MGGLDKETKEPCSSPHSLRIESKVHRGDWILFLGADRAKNFHRSRREWHV